MKRFTFNYQALLDARSAEEQAKKRVLGSILSRRGGLEGDLCRQESFIKSNQHMTRLQLVGPVDIDSLRSHAGQSVQAMRRMHVILLELSEVHRRLEQARMELVELRRQRRTMELLRDRAKDRWVRQERRREHRELDELVSVRTAREEVRQ